ncbi:MAG TPA: hypothetical protein VEZ42_02450 [Pseudonocardia sp.]|nr:hypothetical protein [Pseudonocardia sp.]
MSTRHLARVLAVDDRRENLLALQAILEGMPIELVAVTSGEDAGGAHDAAPAREPTQDAMSTSSSSRSTGLVT